MAAAQAAATTTTNTTHRVKQMKQLWKIQTYHVEICVNRWRMLDLDTQKLSEPLCLLLFSTCRSHSDPPLPPPPSSPTPSPSSRPWTLADH